jgi:hypothetical protein
LKVWTCGIWENFQIFWLLGIEQLFEHFLDLLSRAEFSSDSHPSKTIQCSILDLIFCKYWNFGKLNNFLNRFWICSHGRSFSPIQTIHTLFNVGWQNWLFGAYFLIFGDWTTFWTLFGFALTGRVFIRFAPFKDHSMQLLEPDFLP